MYLLLVSFRAVIDVIAIHTGDAVPASHIYFRPATSTYTSRRRSQFRTLNGKKSRSYADSIARDTDSVEGKQNAGGTLPGYLSFGGIML
ncbi:uncharacterized protein BJ212DRAFT_1373026 [Suillus subaureus]|uniref:Secreted protein n=1 Tax=Suillus subaureus TaxID=48587 RepID=A0A9P7JAX0_9AGAM|nr:uncharacterized protein BJ212DRAFT_1373026 [Suillus subaureus]KAG1811775.1 hypothetical protein BJ212DRAFT_1373026 [Suillus subaureus]